MSNIGQQFNSQILAMIERFSYNFYLVNLNKEIRCTCIEHATDQARPDCKKCLGTGYKITIREVHGAAQTSQLPTTFRSEGFVVAKNYYFPSRHFLNEDDLIVDDGQVYIALEIKDLISFKGTLPYKKAACVFKKFDSKIFINNFNEIINRK